MNIKISGKNLQVGEKLKNIVYSKLEKFEKYFQSDVQMTVTLSHIKDKNVAELTVYLKNGVILRAEEISPQMEQSIDKVVEKITRQLRKHKTNIEKKFRKNESIRFDFIPEYSDIENNSEDNFEIIKSKKFIVKPMDVEEAILQMNMLNHNFYLFLNSENNSINLVYKRNDGKYGLIDTENE